MMPTLRNKLHSFIPAQFHDPLGLLGRLVRSRDRAAFFAVFSAFMGVVLTPVDMLLEIAEAKRYARASAPRLPIILVCGPPRSGTTLVEQVLIDRLPVAYLNNLTSLFPRSPLTANAIFGKGRSHQNRIPYASYYGKTVGLTGPNDALYLWDRWFGPNRTRVPESLSQTKNRDLVRFFGACEELYGQPLVTKNNSLNTYAHFVADALKNVHFICLSREPAYLAQALLRARLEIRGDASLPYGVDEPSSERTADVAQDVCRQVRFHDRKMREEQERIGPDRFWIVRYESFCANPEALVKRVSEKISFHSPEPFAIPPFKSANTIRIDGALFQKLERELADVTERYHER